MCTVNYIVYSKVAIGRCTILHATQLGLRLAIGRILRSVRPLSVYVCKAVHVHCGSRGRCTGLKVVPASSVVLVGKFLSYLSLQTLCSVCCSISFIHETHKKSESNKTWTCVILRQTIRRALVMLRTF